MRCSRSSRPSRWPSCSAHPCSIGSPDLCAMPSWLRPDRPGSFGTSLGPMPSSFAWTARTSGTATTACWRRCCGPSCAAASRSSRASCIAAPAAGMPSTMTSTQRSAMPQRRATRSSRGICCGRTPAATSPRATTRPSAAGSGISPTSRWPPTPRWRSSRPTPTWPTASATTPSIGPPRPLERVPARRRAPGLEAGVTAMRAAIARDGVKRMREDAARASALGADDSPWRSMDRLLEGTACHLLGMRERAGALLAEGSRRGVVGAPSVSALCLSQLSLLAMERDDWARAAELAARARSQLDRFRLGGYPTMSLVLAVAALTQAQRGRVQAAKDDCAEAARLLDQMDDFVPWYVAEVRIVLARVALRLSDVVGARALVEAADLAVRASPDTPVLAQWLEDASAQVEAYSSSAVDAPASLTTAELRILGLLPTHLSFREMGTRLYVSPNTVKTQAQAVYRKLDASSRSEAVARARVLGLLELPSTRALPTAMCPPAHPHAGSP